MVDLPMMSHLLEALSPSARLILIGDKDQLASVEVGSVLADLCDAGNQHGIQPSFAEKLQQITGYLLEGYIEHWSKALQYAEAQLRVSHRVGADSGKAHLATDINVGTESEA